MFQIGKGSVKKKKKKGVSIYLKHSLNIQEKFTLGLNLQVAQRQENRQAPMVCPPLTFAIETVSGHFRVHNSVFFSFPLTNNH